MMLPVRDLRPGTAVRHLDYPDLCGTLIDVIGSCLIVRWDGLDVYETTTARSVLRADVARSESLDRLLRGPHAHQSTGTLSP